MIVDFEQVDIRNWIAFFYCYVQIQNWEQSTKFVTMKAYMLGYQQGHFEISLKTGNENSYTEFEQFPHHDQVHPLVCFVGKRVTYHLIAWCKYKSSGHFVLTRTGIHHRSVDSTVAIANRLEQGDFKHYEMRPLLRPCKNSKSSSFFIESLSNFQLN